MRGSATTPYSVVCTRAASGALSVLFLLSSAPATGHAAPMGEPSKVDKDLRSPVLKYEQIEPGIEYAKFQRANPPLTYHVVRADLRQKNLRLRVLKSLPSLPNGKESVSEIARRSSTDKMRIAAVINGDFFDRGTPGPWGIHVQDGRLLYTPTGKSAFMVDTKGKPTIDIPVADINLQFSGSSRMFKVDDVNRPNLLNNEGFHVFTRTGEFSSLSASRSIAMVVTGGVLTVSGLVTGRIAEVAAGGQVPQLPPESLLLIYSGKTKDDLIASICKKGTALRINFDLKPTKSVCEAISGGPQLVSAGKCLVDFEKEKFSPAHAAELKPNHPRSAAGYNKDRTYVFFVIVEGRSSYSKGLDMQSLAQLMKGLGMWDAIMFDGGGSATLHTEKYVVAGEAGERKVSNALAIAIDDTDGKSRKTASTK